MMVDGPFWQRIEPTDELRQGDYLPGCVAVPALLGDPDVPDGERIPVELIELDVIVVTQSCDLANKGKVKTVALCGVHSIEEVEAAHPKMAKPGAWEPVRQGRQEGIHLLASPDDPESPRASLVVDLREIHCLPLDYVRSKAQKIGPRWRLKPPYREHLSQAFARCYMRVALPTDLPKFS